MNNPIKHILSQLLKFSRSDRNALLILSSLILFALIAKVIVSYWDPEPTSDFTEFEKMLSELETGSTNSVSPTLNLFNFNPNTISENKLDSLSIPSFVKRNLISYRNAGAKFYTVDDLRKVYGMNDSIFNLIKPFVEIKKVVISKPDAPEIIKKKITGYFDPNKADLDELQEFGFNNFQAKNLLNYRSKGGTFKNVDDLLKIYGVDSIFFETIRNHIQIERRIDLPLLEQKVEIINIELNSADSADLVKLNGIGSVYASRIIKYRKLLGGYCSKKQLLEVYNFPDETFYRIEEYIWVDTLLINRLRINFVEFKELLRHPYLNKVQVNALLNYRMENGYFEDVSAIQQVEAINEETFSKIKPYFVCR
jgi:DNA uptake protein ComE-like DNA-binding protein